MKKILVVDDETSIRETLHRFLQKQNFEVESAEDGREGLEKAQARPPDLVIVDALMPNVSGFDLCQILRKRPQTRHVPILFLSAMGRDGMEEEAIKSGADAYLVKPYDYPDLLGTINSLLKSFS